MMMKKKKKKSKKIFFFFLFSFSWLSMQSDTFAKVGASLHDNKLRIH
jgi:hypothetical protein